MGFGGSGYNFGSGVKNTAQVNSLNETVEQEDSFKDKFNFGASPEYGDYDMGRTDSFANAFDNHI